MTNANPRILIISQRRFRPTVCRCSQNEFEDVIQEVDAVSLQAPEGHVPTWPPLVQRVQGKLKRDLKIDVQQLARPMAMPVLGQYDLVFVIVQHPSDLDILHAVPGWRKRARKAVVWVEELWLSDLVYAKLLEPLKQFDHVVTNCKQTCAPLQEKIGVPCTWEPPGIDAIRFCPLPHPPHRTIDFYSIGRRSPRTHEALLALAQQGNFFYVYDTASFKTVLDHRQHRELYANCAKRARYFLANKAKVDKREDRGVQEEVGFRFFEGAAAGTVMVGEAPKSDAFGLCFNWPDALVPLPYDSANIADLLADLDRTPDRLAEIRRANVSQSLLRHDWVYRWARVLGYAGLETCPGMSTRMSRLEALAERVKSL